MAEVKATVEKKINSIVLKTETVVRWLNPDGSEASSTTAIDIELMESDVTPEAFAELESKI
jgi:ligand-binding sensor domain-containing protein